MTIDACIKNREDLRIPHIPSLVALIFKDEGGLANHSLSCHSQGSVWLPRK